MVNPVLLQMASHAVNNPGQVKSAFVPPGGGAPPMDPAAAGGGPPPAAAPPPGGAPPPGAPPMDPAMGGAPPMMPVTGAPMPGAMPGAMPGMPGQDPTKPKKLDPALLDLRMYNMMQILTAIANHLHIKLPPEALMTPPAGMAQPTPEQAMPGMGGPTDMMAGAGGGGGGMPPGGAGLQPIEPMAPPAGGGEKQAADGISPSYIGDAVAMPGVPLATRAAATAQLLRSRARTAGVA